MPLLSGNYPFLTNYFRSGIINSKKQNISHCILFYGSDIDTQYALALEIARLLNCKEGGGDDCECLNCKWIRENKHPAVITVSRLDFKPDDDKTKTVISIRQTQDIRSTLMTTSDYHRVIIFCDKDDNGNLKGLSYRVFQEEAANSLLNTFEEPPADTTFIILTKDKSDMISTIISRCQCFLVPSHSDNCSVAAIPQELMNLYLSFNKNNVFEFQNKLLELTKTVAPDTVLNGLENGLLDLLKNNIDNKHLFLKFKKDLKSIEYAKQQIQLDMSPQTVIDELVFNCNFK